MRRARKAGHVGAHFGHHDFRHPFTDPRDSGFILHLRQ